MKPGPKAGTRSKPAANLSTALRAWGGGEDSPDWVIVLAEACDGSSQTAIAKRLGYSSTVVSQVISRTYSGDVRRVEQAVRGALMAETVMCPVLDEIKRDVCLAHQKRKFDATSALGARIYWACRKGCPNYLGSKESC